MASARVGMAVVGERNITVGAERKERRGGGGGGKVRMKTKSDCVR